MSCPGCAARDEVIGLYKETQKNGADAVRELRADFDLMRDELAQSEQIKRELYEMLKQLIQSLDAILNTSHHSSSAYVIAYKAILFVRQQLQEDEV